MHQTAVLKQTSSAKPSALQAPQQLANKQATVGI